MAGTYTVKHQTIYGDMRCVIYSVTNFTNAETITVPGMREIYHSQAQVAATADKVIALSNAANVITITASADSYDGTLIVYGK